jgi:glutathione S-transferase
MLSLVIGNKNLSSWSLRPWLLMKHFEVDFSEINLTLDTPDFKEAIRNYSPAERVPVLLDDALAIWDSLAICEYLNEKLHGRAWPSDPVRRAHARCVVAEMHSGFSAMRTTWPMNAVGRNLKVPLSAAAAKDVARIDDIWRDCRERFSTNGMWLFGDYSIADAMYAPVVLRFNSYDPTLSASSQAYVQHALDDSHLRAWIADSHTEVAAA